VTTKPDAVTRILLLVDGSPASAAAARMAAAVARAFSARVTAFSVVTPKSAREDLEQALGRAAAELGRHGLSVETAIVEGKLVPAVIERAREGYDLAVLGARKRERWEGERLQSRLWRIARHLPAPVLLVPEEAPPEVRRMLFCSGGERFIDRGAVFAARFARRMSASVVFLHVLPRTPELYLGRKRETRTPAEFLKRGGRLGRQIRSQIGAFEKAGVECDFALEEGDIREKIFHTAGRSGADLVVVGSSPTSAALRTYAMGDVTREIALYSPLPVLVVRSEPASLLRDLWRILREPGPGHW
jgi:nucleotide-binding universal stress UspA family protein